MQTLTSFIYIHGCYIHKMAALEAVGYIRTEKMECFDQLIEFCHLKNILHLSDMEYCDKIGRNKFRMHLYSISSAAEVIQFIEEKRLDAIFVNF